MPNNTSFQARRATLDDLAGLRSLWQMEQLPLNLEKRVTEFQVALDQEEQVIGAMGLQVDGQHGKVHSEVFKDFGLTDTLRPMLWERILTVARNRGMVRLWTQENTLFWRGVDFVPPTPAQLEKFPAKFGDPAAPWFTLKLRDDVLANMTPEQEIALFRDAMLADREKLTKQAATMKWIATVIALLFFIMVIVGAVYLFKYKSYTDRHGRPPQLPPSSAPAPPVPQKK